MRLFLMVTFLFISFYANSQTQNYKYFKHLVFRETPYAQTKGRIPISEERAKNENHYRLTYNAENKLHKIEYRFGDKLIRLSRSGMLDGNRNLASKTIITYEDNKEIRTFYDLDSKQSNNLMKTYKEVYTLNNEGKRINLKHYNKNDQLENNLWKISEYIWTHNNENEVVEHRKNTEGTSAYMRPYYLFLNTIYNYTDEGILISIKNIDTDNNLVEEDTGVAMDAPKYDKDFNLISYNFYDSNNKLVVGTFLGSAGGKVDYDENGNVLEYRTTGLDGEPMMDKRPYVYRRFVYDKYGNMVERVFYDLQNEVFISNGISKIKYHYSKKNPAELFKTEYFHTTLKD